MIDRPLRRIAMGFLFTLLYVVTAYLGPQTIFGVDLALAHVEILIVVIALVFSLFSTPSSGLPKMVQTWAIAGLCVAVAFSIVLTGWIGGGPKMLVTFLPDVIVFFLIVMTCRKKWHIQALVAVLFFVAVFDVTSGSVALLTDDSTSKYILSQVVNEASETFIYRIRGITFLGDPNDFAQFLVSLIPCMFLFWVKGQTGRNLFMVYLPSAFLFFGMYLTHSRGGMVALMVCAIVAGRRKVKLVPAVLIGLAVFAALTAVGFSGGRDVSAGEDRVAAWSVGLTLVRSHPLFGVGFNRFQDYNNITAHNTFVVCAAELGLIGVFCWILMTFITIRNVYVTSIDPNAPVREKKNQPARPLAFAAQSTAEAGNAAMLMRGATSLSPAPISAGNSQAFAFAGGRLESATGATLRHPGDIRFSESDAPEVTDEELRRMCGLMVIMFAGFLTAGWFLSRAYTMCLYVNAGMATAIYGMARERGLTPPPMPLGRALKITAGIVAGLLIVVYVIIRADRFLPH